MFGFSLTSGDPSKLPSALIGKTVPATTLPPLEGLVRSAGVAGAAASVEPVPGIAPADLGNGRVTVVNFWASWCVPCVQEHPMLVEIARRTDAVLLGVNYKDQPAQARRFLGNFGNPFNAVGVDRDGRVAIDWGVYGMPETFVVDGAGRIAYKHVGPITAQTLVDRILPAIANAASPTSGR